MNKLIECVPNFSEGRDKKINTILDHIQASRPGNGLRCRPWERYKSDCSYIGR